MFDFWKTLTIPPAWYRFLKNPIYVISDMAKNESDNAEYDFLSAIAISANVEAYEQAVVPYCSATFSAQSVVAMLFFRNSGPTVLFRWIPDDQLRNIFDRRYDLLGYLLDPFFQISMSTNDWAAYPLRDIAPDRFETSEYFSNYYGSTKMVDEIGFVAKIDDNSSVHLSLGRNAGQRRYRSGEITKFKQLSRVLAPKLKSVLLPQTPTFSTDALSLEHRFCAVSKHHGNEISLREAEVAALIVQGHSSRAIGLNLGISIHTVKVHRRSLYKKLNITSQNELFRLLSAFSENESG
ncbi:helix-turn-helix domain-containing protein [Roseovarius aestuarii]|nr:helix-turn-helix transcriptional regulator [Roseovarius aestuarii]